MGDSADIATVLLVVLANSHVTDAVKPEAPQGVAHVLLFTDFGLDLGYFQARGHQTPAFAVASAAEASASDCWKKTFLATDANAVAECYAPDAVMWIPGGPMLQGRDAIREGYAGFLSTVTVKSAELTLIATRTIGDDQVNWGTFKIVLVNKADGKEITEVGRFTDVTRKIDGRWMYVVDHASDDPPAEVGPSPN